MRQVAAGGKVEPNERVARRHQRHEGGGIGRSARVRLNVCEFTSEKSRNPFNGQVFRDVDILTAAVIAPPRQSFRVFLGKDRPLPFEDPLPATVFRGTTPIYLPLAVP